MPESRLPLLTCPVCLGPMVHIGSPDGFGRATKFEDCFRRCVTCAIGASNGSDSKKVTYIHKDPLGNIPIESRDGANEALSQSFNVRNRKSKRHRFGFSTSEDAVTWVVFTYLLRSGQLLRVLQGAGLSIREPVEGPTLLLWGAPVDGGPRGTEIRDQLTKLCRDRSEDRRSFSEPDVVIDLGAAGVIFVEVKHLSGNARKLPDYPGWSRYASAPGLTWRFNEVKASGSYELARNWCLLKGLAGQRPAVLVNLGPPKLFVGAERARVDAFKAALGTDEQSFKGVAWSDLLNSSMADSPDWFRKFCGDRHLMALSTTGA